MRTLGGSYFKLFCCKQRDEEIIIRCSTEFDLSRLGNNFLGRRNRVSVGSSLATQQQCIHCISAPSSAQTNIETEEIQTVVYSDQPRTVHVRFKLHKECAFGQQFQIVGDDPIFGSWDPFEGVPLNWSEGHLWTVEMDLPSCRVIRYKFILKGPNGTIIWQPGLDRVLETWDTENTISVFDDWDDPELQNIAEEELVDDIDEESLSDGPDTSTAADNLTGYPSASIVAQNISEKSGEQDFSLSDEGFSLTNVTDQRMAEMVPGNDGRAANESNLLSEEMLVPDERVPVLVPGLIPKPPEETEAGLSIKMDEKNVKCASVGCDEVEGKLTEPEAKEEPIYGEPQSTEISGITDDERQEAQAEQHLKSGILEGDIQWGRRTLQKFLANFGFQ